MTQVLRGLVSPLNQSCCEVYGLPRFFNGPDRPSFGCWLEQGTMGLTRGFRGFVTGDIINLGNCVEMVAIVRERGSKCWR